MGNRESEHIGSHKFSSWMALREEKGMVKYKTKMALKGSFLTLNWSSSTPTPDFMNREFKLSSENCIRNILFRSQRKRRNSFNKSQHSGTSLSGWRNSTYRHQTVLTSSAMLHLSTAPPSNPEAKSASAQLGYPQTSGSESMHTYRNTCSWGLLEIVYTIPGAWLIGSNSNSSVWLPVEVLGSVRVLGKQ